MKKKRNQLIVKDKTPQPLPLDGLPSPKTFEEQFWTRFKLLQKNALAGDEIAMREISCLAIDSLSNLTRIWKQQRNKRALNRAIFAIKDALDTLESDYQNPPDELLDLARSSHVWPLLLNPHPDKIEGASATIRKTLKVGVDTGYNYYGRKKIAFTPKKEIVTRLWDEIDSFRLAFQNTATAPKAAWQKNASKLPASTREKGNFALWWKVAWALFLEKYDRNGEPYEENETIRRAFAYESKMLSKYKNKAGWNEANNLRNRIATTLRQEFKTVLP